MKQAQRSLGISILIIALLVGFQAGYLYGYEIDQPRPSVGVSENNSDAKYDSGKQKEEPTISFNVSNRQADLYNSIFRKSRDSVVAVRPRKDGDGRASSVGSGFVYTNQGHIVTNNHVVEGAEVIDVTFLDGTTYEAEIVGKDPYTDLAVLDVQTDESLDPLPIEDTENISVGDSVLAIGNPFGLSGTMTAGIISQTDRLLPAVQGFSIPNVIQTDAAINPGNSGGPLLNIEGEVIGINTAIDTRTSTFSGVGFAIPANTIMRVVDNLIKEGTYRHPWIGVRGVDVSPPMADEMGLAEARGFLVIDVVEDSPADEAGLRAGNNEVTIRGEEITIGGDVIVRLEGKPVRKLSDVLNYLAQESVGDTITMTVLRNGKEKKVELELDQRPSVE